MLRNCSICKSSLSVETFYPRERMLGFNEPFAFKTCQSCGCLQIMEPPSDPGKYYPSYYYSLTTSPYESPLKKRFRIGRDKFEFEKKGLPEGLIALIWPNKFLRLIGSLPSINRNSRILDVGCGYGQHLLMLEELGFKNLEGTDPYNKEVIRHRTFSIQKDELKNLNGPYDLIMLHHVLEHLENQHETFQKIKNLLSENGLMLVAVPLSDSYARKSFGEEWVQWDPPRHHFLHTKESLKILGENNGFELISVMYDSSDFQFWGSKMYRRNNKLYDGVGNPEEKYKYFSALTIVWYKIRASLLNWQKKGDQALFVFQKT